jgi:hypothetical protein
MRRHLVQTADRQTAGWLRGVSGGVPAVQSERQKRAWLRCASARRDILVRHASMVG